MAGAVRVPSHPLSPAGSASGEQRARLSPCCKAWPPSPGDTFLGSCFKCQAERQGDRPEATPTSLGPASSLGGAAALTEDTGQPPPGRTVPQPTSLSQSPEPTLPSSSWLWGSRQDPEFVWASVSWCMKPGETNLLCPPRAVPEAGWRHAWGPVAAVHPTWNACAFLRHGLSRKRAVLTARPKPFLSLLRPHY